MKAFRKATKTGTITRIIVVTLLVVLLICMTACSKAGVPEQNSESDKTDEAVKEVALLSEYWTEGSAAAESINEYMSAVTDASSPDYIPPEDRIAVFDLDGTLMCETDPFCFEYMIFADYALNSGAETVTDEVKSVAQENDFTLYVVTATERNIVREVIRGALEIPPSNVIGTEYGYTATGQGDTADTDYTFQPSDQVVFDGSYYGENAKMSKVDAIMREIGQQPVLAFGNSSGDLAMEIYTISGNPYKSAAFMVLADDEEREFGDAKSAEKKKADYEKQGIGIISMRDDFRTIYGDGVQKTEIKD